MHPCERARLARRIFFTARARIDRSNATSRASRGRRVNAARLLINALIHSFIRMIAIE